MKICLTIDVEWAPDFVVDWMYRKVKASGVPATWFATHDSAILKAISEDPAHEIGLHPNFFGGSTQGESMEKVMKYLISIYPEARGVRSHALMDSTRHQQHYGKMGLKYISNSIVWNMPSEPFFLPWAEIWHIPISWEDDVACNYATALEFNPAGKEDDSIWVLTFHPLYCYLNETRGMSSYESIKKKFPDIAKITIGDLKPLRRKGDGITRTLESVLGLSSKVFKFKTLGAVYDELVDKRR